MAILYGDIASSALMSFDKSFARLNGQPLDSTEVYYKLTDAEAYAKTGAAYVGQKIVVIENNVVTHYSIEDTNGTLKKLGSDDSLADRLQSVENKVGSPATDDDNATGLYLAIANGIQEAKDYADTNDENTTYTLNYSDNTSATGTLSHNATYLITLTNVTIPESAASVTIEQHEIVSWNKNDSTVSFISSEIPQATTEYQVLYYSEGGLPLDGVTVTYGLTNTYASVYDVVGVEIPSSTTNVNSDLAQAIIIWNKGNEIVRIAGNFTDNVPITITYTPAIKIINLVDNKGTIISSIDATPFIKDSMLNDVEYNADNNTLTFIWNTDSGSKTDTVVLSDILDPYTAGNGIEINGTNIAAKIDPKSEGYLSASEDGILLSGISSAIAGIEQTANNASTKVDTLEDKIDEIIADGGEPNVLEGVKVNGTLLDIVDKTVDIQVPTLISQLTDDKKFDERILANKEAIDLINNAESGILIQAQTYVDNKFANTKATSTTLGLVKVDDVTIQSVDGTISAKAISTDLLTQGTEEFILNGGSANGFINGSN